MVCGVTISREATSTRDTLDCPELARKLTVEEMLSRLPEARLFADPVAIPFRGICSSTITPVAGSNCVT